MKKFFIFGIVAAVLSFAVASGVKSYRTTHNTLFYKNLEALANPEDDNEGGGSDPGSGGTNPGGGGGSTPESGEDGVYMKCKGQIPFRCFVTCSNCKTEYVAPYSSGPSTESKGKCEHCGHSF